MAFSLAVHQAFLEVSDLRSQLFFTSFIVATKFSNNSGIFLIQGVPNLRGKTGISGRTRSFQFCDHSPPVLGTPYLFFLNVRRLPRTQHAPAKLATNVRQ